MSDAFELLAEPLRRILWEMQWRELRPIQADAIHAVLESEQDVILSARTASGKTEAAFLPILSAVWSAPASSVRAMYVGPLKALINDQFRRLEDLCAHARIPVHRWHGDVAGGKKRTLLQRPSGVLLITPESLESLFVNHSSALQRLFHSLSFVVIDELHALHGSERGTHLRSLLFRLERYSAAAPRLLALSATLGDPSLSARWLRPAAPDSVRIIQDDSAQKAIRFGIFAYARNPQRPLDRQEPAEADSTAPPAALLDDLYEAFSDVKGLVFANARSDVEWYADALNEIAAGDGRPGQFLVHHGSLSKDVREHTEQLMQGQAPYTTISTSSLELGIDIGNVGVVGQIGCPFSVGSLVQRLGRSGRRDDEPQCMRLCLLEERLPTEASLCDRLRPQLLQAIAMTELMRIKWVEPPGQAAGDLSTVVQQILSVVAETGGLPAIELYERLVSRGSFRQVTSQLFADVLRSIADHDLIEQTPEGVLILGLRGEQIVRSYEFYSAFATSPEFRVVHHGIVLGTLPTIYLPHVGDHLLLAGRRWQVTAIDHERREIAVRPGRGRKAPKFEGGGGVVHPRIRQAMRKILFGDSDYGYLSREASEFLREARVTAGDAALHRSNIVELSPSRSLWFTWTGTLQQQTLSLLATRCRLEVFDREIALELSAPAANVCEAFAGCLRQMPTAESLAELQQWKERRKYDPYLSTDLLTWSFATDVVDLDGATAAITELLA